MLREGLGSVSVSAVISVEGAGWSAAVCSQVS